MALSHRKQVGVRPARPNRQQARRKKTRYFSCLLMLIAETAALSGCGLFTPTKSLLISDTPQKQETGLYVSEQGKYENTIVNHISCEIASGLANLAQFDLPWVEKWGTAITLTITAQDQGGLSPSLLTFNPINNIIRAFPTGGNVTIARSFGLGAGVSGAATATRTETIQFTYLNSDLLQFAADPARRDCSHYEPGLQIDGDLKIWEFLFDKATLAQFGNLSGFDRRSNNFANLSAADKKLQSWQWAVYNTFSEEITFVAAFGGSLTPTWKLYPISYNTSGTTIAAERTYTNDLIITVGPVAPGSAPSGLKPLALNSAAQNQHNARVNANAIATSIQGQQHQ